MSFKIVVCFNMFCNIFSIVRIAVTQESGGTTHYIGERNMVIYNTPKGEEKWREKANNTDQWKQIQVAVLRSDQNTSLTPTQGKQEEEQW